MFCISCYLKRGTALGAQDRASQAQQILNPIPPIVPPPPKRNTPQKQVPSLTHLYCCQQTFLLTLFLLCHCLCLPCIPLLNLLRGRKNCTTVMHSKSRPSTTHYSADEWRLQEGSSCFLYISQQHHYMEPHLRRNYIMQKPEWRTLQPRCF